MIKTLTSKIVYQNRWMRVREDVIERRSGAEGLYGVVEKPNFASIIAMQNGQIQLVSQYRYPIQEQSLELPMGAWPEKPDANPTELALGELREETGYHAHSISHIGFHYVDNGGSTQGCHIFYATDLEFRGKKLDAEEDDLVSLEMQLAVFEEKIISGDITDAATIASYGLAKLKGLV